MKGTIQYIYTSTVSKNYIKIIIINLSGMLAGSHLAPYGTTSPLSKCPSTNTILDQLKL
jgi:hypothetical protein